MFSLMTADEMEPFTQPIPIQGHRCDFVLENKENGIHLAIDGLMVRSIILLLLILRA